MSERKPSDVGGGKREGKRTLHASCLAATNNGGEGGSDVRTYERTSGSSVCGGPPSVRPFGRSSALNVPSWYYYVRLCTMWPSSSSRPHVCYSCYVRRYPPVGRRAAVRIRRTFFAAGKIEKRGEKGQRVPLSHRWRMINNTFSFSLSPAREKYPFPFFPRKAIVPLSISTSDRKKRRARKIYSRA